jgi:hypothetical protein
MTSRRLFIRNYNVTQRCLSVFLILLFYICNQQKLQEQLLILSFTAPIQNHRSSKTCFNNCCSHITTIQIIYNSNCCYRYNGKQNLQVTSEINNNDICSRLSLFDRFGRWRFLQILLDEDEPIDWNDVNYIILSVLDKWIRTHPQDEQDNDDEIIFGTYKIITELVLLLLSSNSNIENFNISDIKILKKLQQILPDPENDEDAYKSLWDTIIELNGRESVKINERTNSSSWNTRCIIARVLLQYDFLTQGIIK